VKRGRNGSAFVLIVAMAACGSRAEGPSAGRSTVATVCSGSISEDCWSWSEVAILPVDGGPARTLDVPRANYADVAWSPDGGSLALVVNNRTIQVLDLRTLSLRVIAEVPTTDSVATPAWSPDGASIAYTWIDHWSGNGMTGGAGAARDATPIAPAKHVHLMVVPASGGDPRQLLSGWAPAWSADGSTIAYGTPSGWVAVADARTGQSGRAVGFGSDPAWSSDSSTLFFDQFGDGLTKIYGAPAGGSSRALAMKQTQEIVSEGTVPRVAADGRLAYLTGEILGPPTISDPDGKNPKRLTNRPASWLSWSPDSSQLAVTFVHITSEPPDLSGVPGSAAIPTRP
jgi:Tol biopolymer transport system component